MRMFRTDSRDGSWPWRFSPPRSWVCAAAGSAGDIELREMGPGLQKELRSCCCTMLIGNGEGTPIPCHMTPLVPALKVAELTPVMSCAEAGVDLRRWARTSSRRARPPPRRDGGEGEVGRSEARREGAAGYNRAVAAMMITQLGALISECKAEIHPRAEGVFALVADRRWVASRGRPARVPAASHPRGPEPVKLTVLQGAAPACSRASCTRKKVALARGNDDSGATTTTTLPEGVHWRIDGPVAASLATGHKAARAGPSLF